MIKQEVIDLWRLCFDDTEEFIRFYFDKKYKDEHALVYWNERGDAVAALQMPLYPMTFAGTRIQTGYISGACTHPLARARGVMKKLLREAFYVMRDRDVLVSTLIPANEWLFDYYYKMGYSPVFDYTPERHTMMEKFIPEERFRVVAIRDEGGVTGQLFDYFTVGMQQRPCCVQHDREDFELILEDLWGSGGALIVAYSENETIVGMAFAESQENCALVKDWLYDSDDVKLTLVRGIMLHLDSGDVFCRTLPTGKADEHRGMARVINVEKMLQLYAIHYPDETFTLKVVDDWLPENTGIYIVGKGDCTKNTGDESEGTELSVQELTQLLLGYHPEQVPGMKNHFKACHPFMSLMLD